MTFIEKSCLLLRFRLWTRIRTNRHPSFHLSHSQFGEDMLVRSLTSDIKAGFYVDIGAHHPVYFSNTYHFYLKGWNGINIDVSNSTIEQFRALRPRDISLQICLSDVEGEEVEYFNFEQSAYNTIDPEMAQRALKQGARLIAKTLVKTRTLASCLDEYLPPGKGIDFLSIDVEGLDARILLGQKWDVIAPRVVAFEMHGRSPLDIARSPVMRYLDTFGYQLAGLCGPTVIVECVKGKRVEAQTPFGREGQESAG